MRGGVERVLDNILGIMLNNHDIALFTLEYHELGLPNLDAITKFQTRSRTNVRGHFRTQVEKRRLVRSVKELKKWNADVVILNKNMGLSGWMSSKISSPLVAYLHDSWSLSQTTLYGRGMPQKRAALLRRLYRLRHLADSESLAHRGLGKTRLVICPSEWLAREVKTNFPDGECVVVPNGVDHSRFVPTWGDKGYALCGGRLSREKNYELAIKAATAAGCPLVICGSTGQGNAKVQSMQYLAELKAIAGDNVRFQLDIEDKMYIRLLQECSLFLHPGRKEIFPLAPLEAMACGKPVIALKTGGTPEVVEGGGILLDEDFRRWQEEIERIMSSQQTRTELGERAHHQSEQFTWERTANDLSRVLALVSR